MKALVYIEHNGNALNPDSIAILGHLKAAGFETHAVLCGSGVASFATETARYADVVLIVDHESLSQRNATVHASAISRIPDIGAFDLVALGTSVLGTELAAALAVKLDGGVVWSVLNIAVRDGQIVATRSAHNDASVVDVGWSEGHSRVALFRYRGLTPKEPNSTEGQVVTIDLEFDASGQRIQSSVASLSASNSMPKGTSQPGSPATSAKPVCR